MSPSNRPTTSPNPASDMSSMVQRRRQQQNANAAADGQAAAAGADGQAAAASADAAARVPAAAEQHALIGQEIVPASTALVPVSGQEASRTEGTETLALAVREEPNQDVRTPTTRRDEGFQSPQALPSPVPNGMSGNRSEAEVHRQVEVMQGVPTGPPVSFGPSPVSPIPVSPVPVIPLFTPEQQQRFLDLERQAPLLYPHRRGAPMTPAAGSGFLSVRPGGTPNGPDLPPGQLALPAQDMDSVQREWREYQQRELQQQEAMWRWQMEQMMSTLGVQLRASHAENQRLREEMDALRFRGESRFHTPEEDGTRVRQERPQVERAHRQRVQEDGTVVRQAQPVEEDGTVVRQAQPVEEDGTVVRQAQPVEEDGTEVRQAQLVEEEGAEAQQETSEEESVQGQPRTTQRSSDPPRRRRSTGTADPTMEVILQLVQGMQTMQRQLIDSRDRQDEAEVVRQATELPKLPEWDPETAPIDYSDWQLCLAAHMGDLSSTSEAWWSTTMEVAKAWYSDHMRMTPMQRLTHYPRPTEELQQPRWVRLERRASAMLMAALPDQLREEVISSKTVSSLGIMCKAMLQYQPGGLTERAAILSALEQPQEAQSIASAVSQVRKWIRWKRRATELGVSMPDSTILVKGLSKLLKKVIGGNQDLSFRLSLARNALLIDTIPTQESVSQYTEHVLAELEQMGHHARRKEGGASEGGPKVRKMEEQGKTEEGSRGRGKPREEVEAKKSPCRFFLTEQGCRRGKQCPYGHVLDNEKRCWTCGSKEHFAGSCPRGEEGKTAKVAKAGAKTERGSRPESSSKPAEAVSEAKAEVQSEASEDPMKALLEEANRMIKSMENPEATEKRMNPMGTGVKIQDLHNQLEALKKAALRPFRISKLGGLPDKGLIDSGATHPLRARKRGEKVSKMPKVSVMLAGDKIIQMHLTPTGVILGDENTEPIVPMGMLTSMLQCKMVWNQEGLRILHPKRGEIEVRLEDGCPMVPKNEALRLIEEIEGVNEVKINKIVMAIDPEISFLKKLVSEHPAFAGIPQHLKDELVEQPAEDLLSLGNRRMRKLWRKKGVVIHAFSGGNEGYTLKRALHEVGGDRRLLYEFDVLDKKMESDLSKGGRAYPLMLRLALEGQVKGWVGGPPCRTRSVLRHQEIPGLDLPRPLRSWEGEEFGRRDLSTFEKEQVFTDDLLMLRFMMLFIISEMVRKSRGEEKQTLMLLEQPAEPAWKPEVVSLWRTSQWRAMEDVYGFERQSFDQSEFGAVATKPTTIGGNVQLEVPLKGRKGEPRRTEGKSSQEICEESRKLSRWPPAMMRAIAEVVQTQVHQQPVKIRALSWDEHVRMGHTPFRRDCKTCQMASARDFTHRRSKLPPKVGVLSLDTAGPLRETSDLGIRKKARYLLVGAFTWFAKEESQEDAEERIEVPADAPVLEEFEDEDQRQAALEIEDAAQEDQGEVDAEGGLGDQRPVRLASEEGDEAGEAPQEEGEREVREDVKVSVTRLCVPLASRNKQVVLKAIADMYLRLKADGYHVQQLHTDRGGEYTSEALADWCRTRDVLHTFTPGDSPQTNGRAEVAVQQVKAEIRRALQGAGAGFERWPLAARFVNEVNRLKQTGRETKHPGFLQKVLIRKRFWRSRELEPTQEEVTYIAPSWVNHGHWVERPGGAHALTRMVMSGLKEPTTEEHWLALEDAMNPVDERRRLRGKVAVYQYRAEEGGEEEDREEDDSEEDEESHRRRNDFGRERL